MRSPFAQQVHCVHSGGIVCVDADGARRAIVSVQNSPPRAYFWDLGGQASAQCLALEGKCRFVDLNADLVYFLNVA